MESAATILREARFRAGLSQRAVAEAAGVRQPLVSRVETGREQPSLQTLGRLVEACGYAIEADLVPEPDDHDRGLLTTTLSLSPEARVDRLVALHRTADELRRAVTRAGGAHG